LKLTAFFQLICHGGQSKSADRVRFKRDIGVVIQYYDTQFESGICLTFSFNVGNLIVIQNFIRIFDVAWFFPQREIFVKVLERYLTLSLNFSWSLLVFLAMHHVFSQWFLGAFSQQNFPTRNFHPGEEIDGLVKYSLWRKLL
jgi:hypothetical protein